METVSLKEKQKTGWFAEKNWHRLFEFGVALKGLDGILEVASGSFILFVSKNSFNNAFLRLSRGELIEDPHDRLINFVAYYLQHLSNNTKIFAALYVLIHGLLNIFLAIQLYRKRLWAYIFTISVMVLFMSYQIYRISQTHSVTLTIITVWDALFIIITWHEYKYRNNLDKFAGRVYTKGAGKHEDPPTQKDIDEAVERERERRRRETNQENQKKAA